ncbi:MAG TPA: hypothetical protein VFJ70_03515 [Burkholderiales bacterium]|nr:hypothetical protein [Burkholderiales bacterium]
MSLGRAKLSKAVEHLRAGDWQVAHEIVQKDEDSPLARWAHGIVHLMEGDRANARYWYRQAKRVFPADADARAETEALARALGGKD